jgi:hypothetical protein
VIQIVCDFDELDRLRFHDKATQVDDEKIDMEEEKLRLMFEVTRQRLLQMIWQSRIRMKRRSCNIT